MNKNFDSEITKGGNMPPSFDDLKAEIVGDAVILLIAREMLARRFPEIPKFKYAKIVWILVSNKELNVIAENTQTAPAIHKCETWKTAASGFEARIGKIFAAKGYSAARRFVERQFLARFDILAMASNCRKHEQLIPIYKTENGNIKKTEKQ